ncbi:MAG: biotin--[acetyl-CoA-carboxylase] ligase [Candidatus Methanofastidiosum sp.]|nr:biotin--[acetyl-CoA-carboxylase] ligase [Methanofastidiosum sp.]HOT85192.1 biotin--[acetyl-CoA-carboxylase] ligase [Methanofastidiosum sp.]HQF89483.1 biotin--[acetyl-CoA-carboxylase] ligase [Methanofastidiosum sp.]HQG61069.1 biotin--[acetyl-CoA-carboxylase] ligase [Methanofastidiosum sp.]HQK84603.1 biotin--[acetyl-CoA-carboxylase] ligase [Methanofastidiosum sp.]
MKSKILEILEKSEGYVSGEVISKEIGISRAAIWKHIKKLREQGYEIGSKTNEGYKLIKTPDYLTGFELERILFTDIIGKKVLFFEEVDSTNNKAKQIASEEKEGTVVISEVQTSGRGRRGREWNSPKGGIYISFILKPNIPPERAPQLTLVSSLALAETLNSMDKKLDAKIKWPNDILIKGKKISGILTELSSDIEKINHIVVGVGVNLNTDKNALPETGTSLKTEMGENVSIKLFLKLFLEHFDLVYKEYITNGINKIIERWKFNSDTLGKKVKIIGMNETFEGLAKDIDENGALILKTGEKEIKVYSGDVSLR